MLLENVMFGRETSLDYWHGLLVRITLITLRTQVFVTLSKFIENRSFESIIGLPIGCK